MKDRSNANLKGSERGIQKHNYGEVFKQLRKGKEEKLTELVKKTGISKSTLSRFEAGTTTLTLDQLDAVLEAIHVDLAEYDYFLNNFQHNYLEDYLIKIEESYYAGDLKRLEKIFSEADFYGQRMIALSAKALWKGLEEIETVEVSSFLMGVKKFTFYELSILTNCISSFSPIMISSTLSDLKKQNPKFEHRFRYCRLLCEMACRGAFKCVTEGAQKEASVALEFAKSLLFERDLFAKNMYYFTKGYYNYRFNDTEQGVREMQQVIEIFDLEDCQNLVKLYRDEFETWVVKSRKPVWLQDKVDKLLEKGS